MTKRFSLTLLGVLLLGLFVGLSSPASEAKAADNSRYFSQTGHTVSGKFLDYWNANGGLTVFGYPITEAQNEQDTETGNLYLTQWFERNRFELHPEFANTKYEVELGLLGKSLTRNRIATDPTFQPTTSKTGYYFFSQTKHNVGSLFYSFWQNNGDLARLGFPIDEPQQEVDPATGHTFTIQWFERARLEYHPENLPPYNVELGLLGREIKLFEPTSLISTYYAAISNKAYWQAYNYWGDPLQNLPPYNTWVQGFANTAAVAVTTGSYTVDIGAGQAYSKVPTVLVAKQTDGSTQTFYGCYTTHRINIQPDSPWRISSAAIQQDKSGASVSTLLNNATSTCQ